jgi:transposase
MADNDVRFVALDIHKTYAMVAALDAQQTVVLPPRRVPLAQLTEWARRHLRPTDQVVLEATTNTWAIYDQLTPRVARLVVAHPAQVRLIAASLVKTDTRDTLSLARLLAANLVPAVWVPPTHVRELRSLIAHRQRLVQQRTAAKNRLHGIVQRHNLVLPEGDLWSHKHQEWWELQPLASVERLRARQDLASIGLLTTQIAEVEAELARLSTQAPWADQVPFLIQLPGVALVSAMTVLSAIGDITRFPSAKHLVGYSGLGARVHASGKTNRSGGVTKQGRRELRAVLIEAAHAAKASSPLWRMAL